MQTFASNAEEFNLDDVDPSVTIPHVVTLKHYSRNYSFQWACKAVDSNVAQHLAETRNPGYIAQKVFAMPEFDDNDIEAINRAA